MASAKLDLPLPLRPVTTVRPGPGGSATVRAGPMPRKPCTVTDVSTAPFPWEPAAGEATGGVGPAPGSAGGSAVSESATSDRTASLSPEASSRRVTSARRPPAARSFAVRVCSAATAAASASCALCTGGAMVQLAFFQVWQPWVLKISPLRTVTRPLPLRLLLAMIESNSPLESLSRSQ